MFGAGLYSEGLMFGNLLPPVSYLRESEQIILVFRWKDSAFLNIFDKLRLMSYSVSTPFSYTYTLISCKNKLCKNVEVKILLKI